MRVPEERKSETQAIKRSRSIPAPLSGSRAEMLQQPMNQRVWQNGEERQEEGIGQSSNEH